MGEDITFKSQSKTMTLKNSKEISRQQWRIMIWSSIIVGIIIFSIFSSTFFLPKEFVRVGYGIAGGGLLIGLGFGFAFSRIFKIEEIDIE